MHCRTRYTGHRNTAIMLCFYNYIMLLRLLYVVLTSTNCLIVRLFSDTVCHRIYNKRR